MNPRPQKGPRLYARRRGDGPARFYADLRTLGRGYVPLVVEGETLATTDPVIAAKLLADLLAEIQEERRDGTLLGVKRRVTLQAYVAEHLKKKARSGRVTAGHIALLEKHLLEAIAFFGAERPLAGIGVEHVQGYAHRLADIQNGRGQTLSSATQRKYLNALSNLFRRAQSEGVIRGVNPVAALMDKPIPERKEAPWLEVWEGALLLEAARLFPTERRTRSAGERLAAAIEREIGPGLAGREAFAERMRSRGFPTTLGQVATYAEGQRIPTRRFLQEAAAALRVPEERLLRSRGWNREVPTVSAMTHPLLAAFLLTGGRESEVLGLELGDVNLRHGVVHFRPNARRRLKTSTSRRTVPLWPQLREVLEPWVEMRRAAGATDGDLLFPSERLAEKSNGMVSDVRKALDAVASAAGWKKGEIRTKAFRHGYCAARLQTLDRGHPVSVYTVARELGHGGEAMVKRVYGHLGQVRHRSDVVEYRIEQQREEIPAERLRLLLRVS